MGCVYRGEVKATNPVKTPSSSARPFPSSIFFSFFHFRSADFYVYLFFKHGSNQDSTLSCLLPFPNLRRFFLGEHQRLLARTNVAAGNIIIIKILLSERLLSLPCNKSYSAISQYFSSYNCSPDVPNKHTHIMHKGDLGFI